MQRALKLKRYARQRLLTARISSLPCHAYTTSPPPTHTQLCKHVCSIRKMEMNRRDKSAKRKEGIQLNIHPQCVRMRPLLCACMCVCVYVQLLTFASQLAEQTEGGLQQARSFQSDYQEESNRISFLFFFFVPK